MSGAYSFLDVTATISGPGGSVNLAADAGISDEGILIEAIDDKNTMTIGAGGAGMHNLSASKAATVKVVLLKTSPTNSKLQKMFEYQTGSSSTHGRNTVTVRDSARGDLHKCEGVAFKKQPSVGYAKEGATLEWMFDCIKWTPLLGVGTPAI